MNNTDINESINDYIYDDNEVIDEINELPIEPNIIFGAGTDHSPTYASNTAQCGGCLSGHTCYAIGTCDSTSCNINNVYSADVCQSDSLNDCMSVWKKIIDSVVIIDPNNPQYPDNLRNKYMTYNDLYGYLPTLDQIIDVMIENYQNYWDMGDEVWDMIVRPWLDIDGWNSYSNDNIRFRALDNNGNVIDEANSSDPNADRLLRGNDIEYCQRLQRYNLDLSIGLSLQPWVFTYSYNDYNGITHTVTQTTTYKVELKFSYTIKIYDTNDVLYGTYTDTDVVITAVSEGYQPTPSGSWSIGGNTLEHLQNNFSAINSYILEDNEFATLHIYNISTRFVVATNAGVWDDNGGTNDWNLSSLDKTITTSLGIGNIGLRYYIEQSGTNVTRHLEFI